MFFILGGIFSRLTITIRYNGDIGGLLYYYKVLFTIFRDDRVFITDDLCILKDLIKVLGDNGLFCGAVTGNFLARVRTMTILYIILRRKIDPDKTIAILVGNMK